MFVTHHDFAEYHALLRCFSTAPMYITDSEPSNLKIFKRLGGYTADREYQIVKTLENAAVRLPSTAFTDVLGDGDGLALKVALPVRSANGAIIGIWNCRGKGGSAVDALTKQEIMEVLTLDKPDKRQDARYVIMYNVNSVQALGSLDAEISEEGHGDIVLPVHLAAASCKTVTIAEIKSYSSFDLAVLGLGDKYVGLCAVTSIEEHKSTQMEEPSVPETVMVPSKVNGSERTASEETLRQSEDTKGPHEAALSEAAPLLPSKPTLAPARRGSRLLALLLFFRRDLSNARKAFFKDFFASPFRTLVREVRAVFGGPSTLPDASEEEERSSFETSHQAPEMLETAGATPKTYGTMSNGAVDTNHTTQHEGDLSLHSESSGATAVNELKTPDEVIVKLSVTGKAVFWIPDFVLEHYRFTLQGQEVPEKMLEASGDCVVLDLDSAVQDLSITDAAASSEGWQIGISKKMTDIKMVVS